MLKIRTILFPTDFSECSRQAFAHALFLAEQHDAKLHLFHAIVLHDDDPANPARRFPGGQDLLTTLTEIAGSKLASLVEPHEKRPVDVQEYTARGVSAADLILEHAREHDVDLIVMGTHGRRGPARLFLGSVAAEVVRSSRAPVLTLRQLGEGRSLEAIERILVPVDFSEHSRAALLHATELARSYRARLQLLHVIQQPVYPYFYAPVPAVAPVEEVQGLRKRGLRALEKLVETAGDPKLDHDFELVDGHPASEIVDFARDRGCDLIVTATHGLTGLERLLLGSTSEQIVRTSPVPVLMVKSFGKSLVSDPPGAEQAPDARARTPVTA